MLSVLSHPVFARLFAAQAVAILGTGLLTVALALLAFDLAGEGAGVVLGTAFAIKMVAYVVLAPLAAALTARLPRRAILVGADLIRAGIALMLPFVSEVWQVYGLIFVLQAASATFNPAFQATIPDVLPDEGEYTRALSLTRLAYDLETLISPALAGLALLFFTFDALFVGTALGFLASALVILRTPLPAPDATVDRPFSERLTRGLRLYLATPRLRGLFALNFAAAAVGAFVLVNSVVVVRSLFGGDEAALALAMAMFGAGSMAAALALPGLLERVRDRPVMLSAATVLALLGALTALLGATEALSWTGVLVMWVAIGVVYSAVLTPAGRLIRRSAHVEDRPALFTAQFALSHLGWLVTYPLAGWLGSALGLWPALGIAALLAALAILAALRLWPVGDPEVVAHAHPDLPPDHPHLKGATGDRHAHALVIDDEHRVWPTDGALR